MRKTPVSPTPAKTPAKTSAARSRTATPARAAAKRPPAKAAKPAATTTAPATANAAADSAAAAKPPKHKLVRDSFTIPRSEYQVLDALKQRLVQLTRPAKKSELLRAGIKLLAALPDEALIAALAAVPSIKTGRPGKSKG
ncbi:hypothetical protein [Aquabacterium sp.]|uniref:hypothetical protein n=1 Tax=Aquabacterium sp. TaxID=1872578 RepID=UPI0037830C97